MAGYHGIGRDEYADATFDRFKIRVGMHSVPPKSGVSTDSLESIRQHQSIYRHHLEMYSLFPVSCCVRSGNNWAALDSHAQLPAGGACRNGANIAVEVRLQSRILRSNTVHETLTIGSISLDSSMIMSCAIRRGLQDCKLQPSAGGLRGQIRGMVTLWTQGLTQTLGRWNSLTFAWI